MAQYYLSIYNRDTKELSYSGPKDSTSSLLKVEGAICQAVFDKAIFIVKDGRVLKKKAARYPDADVGEMLDSAQLAKIEAGYQKTTTKHLDSFEKIVQILT